MIGIIIASHGKLAEEILKSAYMIMGPQENIVALGLEPESDPLELKDKIYKSATEIDTGCGVVILVDLLGGSPGNVSAYLAKEGYPVITGFNLPMLLELIAMRHGDIEETVNHIIHTGKDGIVDLRKALRG